MSATKIRERLKPTEEIVKACENVFLARAHTQTIRPIVEGYQREILAKHRFTNAREVEQAAQYGFKEELVVILEPRRAHLLSEEEFTVYAQECYERVKENGLTVESPEHCPLLVAEGLQRKAERFFLEQMKSITDINPEDILSLGLDEYREYVELSLRLIAPYCGKANEILLNK